MPAFTGGVPAPGINWQLDENHAEPASFSEERMAVDAVQVWPDMERCKGILAIADAKGKALHDWEVGIRHPLRRQDWKRLWVVCQRQELKRGTYSQYLMLFDGNEHGETVHKIDSIDFSPRWGEHSITKIAEINTRIRFE